MFELADIWLDNNALWLDALALVFVCAIALKRRDVISLVIMADFALTILGYSLIRSLPIWPDIDMDYQYVLGAKDTLVALLLIILAANPLITLGYILGALACWSVWGGYAAVLDYRLDYYVWIEYFFAWSPIYFCIMLLEIYGLSRGDGNVGKRIRRTIIPINWDRLFQPIHSFVYARITLIGFKIKRA